MPTTTGTFVSNAWVPAPLYACLKRADERLGPDRVWAGSTAEQKEFLAHFAAALQDLGLLSEDEFRSLLSDTADEINDWLKRNGFDIELRPLAKGEFATAAIVRLGAEWKVQGRAIQMRMEDGRTRPAVLMRKESFEGFESASHPHPIARIAGTNGTQWFITKASESLQGQALFEHLRKIDADLTHLAAEELRFPKVDFDQMGEVGVMVGLQTVAQSGDPWEVSQAVQQTRIKMNEIGGLAESAAAVGFRTCVIQAPPPIVIDGPMWLWIKKPGMTLPLFTAQFGYDVLKDPGTIEFNRPVVK